jgi:hypothetical protein
MQLNSSGSLTDYNIPVSTSQQFQATLTVDSITGTFVVDVTYLLTNGSTSVLTSANMTTTGAKTFDFTTPAGAILARISIRSTVNGTITYRLPNFNRTTVTAPFNLMRITDTYPDQAAAIEYIDCYFQTKSYDYKAPGNFKRIYWAGMDVKATRQITAESRPVSRVVPVLWSQLEAYTFDQLAQGVWGNPLSWLTSVIADIDLLPEDLLPSENGRYFKKFAGAMRFRQMSYIIRMSSLGNADTGPIKFFTITTYVNTKQEVVDAST